MMEASQNFQSHSFNKSSKRPLKVNNQICSLLNEIAIPEDERNERALQEIQNQKNKMLTN